MVKAIYSFSALIGAVVATLFLSGAGVGFYGWYSLPANVSKLVVTISTIFFFVLIFLFLTEKIFKFKIKS